jgi:hypothetical protein
MSVLFGYFTGYVKDFQLGSGSAVMELMEIEDVWFRDSNSKIEIWVFNYGKINFTLNSLYINDTGVDASLIHVNSQYVNGVPIVFKDNEIAAGGHANITVIKDLSSGPCYLKLFTERGSYIERTETAP